MMLWSQYFRAEMVILEVISCWPKNRGNMGVLTTVNGSVYSMPIGNSPGWLKVSPDGDCC